MIFIKNIYVITVVLLLVNACGSTMKKGSISQQQSRFGIAFPINYQPKLCHSNIGITVFNNKFKEYTLNTDLSSVVTQGYKLGIESSGNQAIEIPNMPDLQKHVEVNSWNGIPTLTAAGILTVKELRKNLEIDYLLYPSSYTSIPKKFINDCWGIKLKTGGNTSVPYVPLYATWVFNADTGDYIGSTFIGNGFLDVKLPHNNDNLTSEEIDYYVSMAGKYAENGIRKLIEEAR